MKEILDSINNVIKTSKEQIVNKSLKRLDVVSRDEFDTQKNILLKTRQKLDEIERKLDQLINDNF